MAEFLLGDRPDRLAGVGPLHDQPQAERHDDHNAESDDPGNRQKGCANFDDVKAVGQVDGARVGPEGVEQCILDDDRKAKRHQKDIAVFAMSGGADNEALQRVAQQIEKRAQYDGGGIGIEPEQPVGKKRRKHRGGEQRAVGEIDDVQHAIDQREPERDEGVDGAGHQSVKYRRNDDV
jgi:hypothetical protein